MLKYFRRVRQQLLKENKFSKYLLYAIGEIVLVVLGILIALQINNNNEARKTEQKKDNYLIGIKADLQLNLSGLEGIISARKTAVRSAGIILDYFEGNRAVLPDSFNLHNLNVQIWYPLNQNDNTFQELLNSGNLAIISDDSIRNSLLNLQLLYKTITFQESHMRHDYVNYLYPIYFSIADLNPSIKNYAYQLSAGAAGENSVLSENEIMEMLQNRTFKNGFVLAIFNSNHLIDNYSDMLEMTKKLIRSIEIDLN